MGGSNSNPNTSFVISSVIKTIIMLVIVGAILYILKEYQADFYNQKIYSILTGKKLQTVAVAQASSQEYESGATGYVEGETNPIYEVQEIAPEVDNRVVVSSVKTSSTVKRVIIPGEEPKVKVPVVQNVQEEENIPTQTPKFIDGYETEKCVDKIINMLYDEWVNVRIYAVTSLGKLNDTKAVPALIEVMQNKKENDLVRAGAAAALGVLRDQRALMPLREFIMAADELGELEDTALKSFKKIMAANWQAIPGAAPQKKTVGV